MSPIERVRARAAAAELLGLRRNADHEEVRAAWRRAALELHPDKAGGDRARFSDAHAAYAFLSDDAENDRFTMASSARANETVAPSARQVVHRPKLAKREISLPAEVIAECRAFLANDGAEEAPAVLTAADHVAGAVVREGREITYQVETPLVAGRNRVAVPTSWVDCARKPKPAVLTFSSPRAGSGEILVPDAVRQRVFPGARSVRLRFASA